MSTYTYNNILIHAEQLSATEHLRLIKALLDSFNKQLASLESIEDTIPQIEEDLQSIEDAIAQAHQNIGSGKLHSIMELEGLGKEIWEGIDAQEYVDQERNSWDQ